MGVWRHSLSVCLVVAAAAPAAAESGFQGSYVGVVVDPNRTGDALPSLLTTINQSNWVFDEALRQYRSTRPTTTVTPTSPDSQAPRGNQFQGRVDFANSPLSLRGTVFVGESTTAVLPSLSYDVGVGKNTNIYAGVGYAVVDAPAVSTPIGNQSGVVVTTGLEAAAGKNLVIFGDAKLNLNDRTPDGSSKVRVQFGAGLRF